MIRLCTELNIKIKKAAFYFVVYIAENFHGNSTKIEQNNI